MKFLCTAALLLAVCVTGFAQDKKTYNVSIKNAQGQVVGAALLAPAAKGVRITLDIKSLPPGQHSMHIHQVGKCDAPDFKSAGAHFDPGGMHTHDGHPAGDIPDFSLIVGADGTAHVTTLAPEVTLGSDDHSVFSMAEPRLSFTLWRETPRVAPRPESPAELSARANRFKSCHSVASQTPSTEITIFCKVLTACMSVVVSCF